MDPVTRDSVTPASQSQESASSPIVVAAFDVDKTLTTRDCVVPFLRRVGGAAFVVRLAVGGPRLLTAMVRRRRDRIKVIATRAAVRGRPVAEVDIVAHRFADEVWNRHMRSDTVARLRWHLGRGHRVVLVSASYRNYLEPLAEHLGAHAVISTELEVVNGVCTGELRGPNCRAAVKASRLRGWIDEQGWSAVEIHAYGDSAGDREMLADARRATWVGASPIGAEPNTSDEETPS